VPPPPEVRTDPGHLDALAAVAAHYSVPLVSLRGAADLGLLRELGVPRALIREAASLAASAGR
jgi:hypothetical protein